MMRVMLYEAAQSMLRSKKWSWLKAWAMQIARRRGMKKAIVALARRLAVIMHRVWVDGTEFRWTREVAAASEPYGIKSRNRRRKKMRGPGKFLDKESPIQGPLVPIPKRSTSP